MTSIILFDIDGTLFNSKKWIDGYIKDQMNTIYGMDGAEYEAIRQEYRDQLAKPTLFKPEEFLELLHQKSRVDINELKTMLYTPRFFAGAVYEEVIPTLDQLVAKELSLGVYSEGNYQFQLSKLKYGEVATYFDPDLLFITGDKQAPEYIETLPVESMVVDDHLEITQALQRSGRCQPIWINRHSNEKDPHIQTIHNLADILDII